eukprot:Seg1213.6 transcript_id=Seg1213.6/GoldUCD/mRNA.D3Y31 product="hypothetical protein" protein_id=Seg1213.6/GoldUCD/D3Y31
MAGRIWESATAEALTDCHIDDANASNFYEPSLLAKINKFVKGHIIEGMKAQDDVFSAMYQDIFFDLHNDCCIPKIGSINSSTHETFAPSDSKPMLPDEFNIHVMLSWPVDLKGAIYDQLTKPGFVKIKTRKVPSKLIEKNSQLADFQSLFRKPNKPVESTLDMDISEPETSCPSDTKLADFQYVLCPKLVSEWFEEVCQVGLNHVQMKGGLAELKIDRLLPMPPKNTCMELNVAFTDGLKIILHLQPLMILGPPNDENVMFCIPKNDSDFWQCCFPLKESAIVEKSECAKKIFSCLKRIRDVQQSTIPIFNKLNNYHLKTIVMLTKGASVWSIESIGSHLLSTLHKWLSCLSQNSIPWYFDHRINLLPKNLKRKAKDSAGSKFGTPFKGTNNSENMDLVYKDWFLTHMIRDISVNPSLLADYVTKPCQQPDKSD